MKNMIYKSAIGSLDLSTLTRLYPAVVVETEGEKAEMSLEWADSYGDKVNILSYILVFDYTPQNQEEKDRRVLEYNTRDELIQTIGEVAQFFQD